MTRTIEATPPPVNGHDTADTAGERLRAAFARFADAQSAAMAEQYMRGAAAERARLQADLDAARADADRWRERYAQARREQRDLVARAYSSGFDAGRVRGARGAGEVF